MTLTQDYAGCHVLEDLRSVKSYIWPLFNFHPKFFSETKEHSFLFIFYATQNFQISHSFGYLNRLFTKVSLYITYLFSVTEFWFCFIRPMLLNFRIFQPQESDEMFTVLFYKYKNVYCCYYYSTFVKHPQSAGC